MAEFMRDTRMERPIPLRILAFMSCLLVAIVSVRASDRDSLLKVLDRELTQYKTLQNNKERYISGLRNRYINATDIVTRFSLCHELYQEYKNFQYDSAFSYANRMYDIAVSGNSDSWKLETARIALMECYNSVGLFKEADEMLRNIEEKNIPKESLADFYKICTRYYSNMNSYAGPESPLGHKYLDSLASYNDKILAISPPDSYDYASAQITRRDLADVPWLELADMYASLPDRFKIDDHELAVIHSQAGRAYIGAGKMDLAVKHLALSAIHDIRSCTRETTAAKDLATIMHTEGQLDRANSYIHHALEDARAFNSRIRLIEINSVLPTIETTRYGHITARVYQLVIVVIVVVGLFILSLWLFFKLRRRNRVLAESHEVIRRKTEELEISNKALQDLNRRLKETGEIKDQYIIQSLIGNTDFVGEVEGSVKRALAKLKARQYDEVSRILHETGTKNERERMYSSFDSAFLKLFPNFPEEFNALFPEDERMDIDERKGLPTEVRIYALMRLGIDNAAEVANYLNLSVNTVYVYKTKLKSKSIVSKDDFDKCVMRIPKP